MTTLRCAVRQLSIGATDLQLETDATALNEYSGVWYSPDLDVRYEITMKDGRLHWAWPVNESGYDLRPFEKDQFRFCTPDSAPRCQGADFDFKRDDSGRIVELSVSLARARNIRFERVLAQR